MAASLGLYPENFPWKNFPWQEAIIHFARALGNVHLNKIDDASKELEQLRSFYNVLNEQKNKAFEAAHVDVQIKSAEAWLELKKGNKEKAKELMRAAADKEDAMAKHPVTPCAVLPARELLGEMLLEMEEYTLAEVAFAENLKLNPNRLNGVIGMDLAKHRHKQ